MSKQSFVDEILAKMKGFVGGDRQRWPGRHVGPKFIIEVFGESRRFRRLRRRKALNRIMQEYRGKGEGTKLAKTLWPAAVAKALKKQARDMAAVAKLRKRSLATKEA